MSTKSRGVSGFPWRIAGWGIAAMLLLLPAVAMQFTREVNWTASDFIFAGVLIGGVGGAFELVIRRNGNLAYRGAVACALASSFLIVWANAAVGMIGSEHDGYNHLFHGVVLVALIGAIAVRFRASAMALVMLAVATLHALVALGGLAADPRGGVMSLVLGTGWLISAALFRRAAQAG